MDRYTYRALIRKYSDDVDKSYADTDLTPRQRRLVRNMLNLASNYGMAYVQYPPSDGTRDETVKYLSDLMWDARWLALAVSPSSDDDVTMAHECTVAILRGI